LISERKSSIKASLNQLSLNHLLLKLCIYSPIIFIHLRVQLHDITTVNMTRYKVVTANFIVSHNEFPF